MSGIPEIINELRIERISQGLSQVNLAKKCGGISPTTICLMETTGKLPSGSTLTKLLNTLGLKIKIDRICPKCGGRDIRQVSHVHKNPRFRVSVCFDCMGDKS